MIETNQGTKTFEEFVEMVAEVMLIPKEKLTPQTSFTDDLFIDSLKLVEMALRIEQLGVTIPSEKYWDILTIDDAYKVYLEHNVTQS